MMPLSNALANNGSYYCLEEKTQHRTKVLLTMSEMSANATHT